jgi:hypothetical protein
MIFFVGAALAAKAQCIKTFAAKAAPTLPFPPIMQARKSLINGAIACPNLSSLFSPCAALFLRVLCVYRFML